jgi:signal transduction histidine kinase
VSRGELYKSKLEDARSDVVERDERIAAMERSHLRLEDLYTISKMLTRFESVERTVPDVIAVVARTVPLRSVLFVLEGGEQLRTLTFVEGGESAERVREVTVQAQAAYRSLARSGADLERAAAQTLELPPLHEAPSETTAEGRAARSIGRTARFVMLPFVVDRGAIFGALQVEAVGALDELDVVFINALVNQLAIGLDRHAADQALRASEKKLQRAVHARDEVLSIVAHDLRNPLNTILMQAELLRRREAGPRPAEKIVFTASRMGRIIEDLLDVARMEAGHLSVEQARVAAAEVISDSVAAQQPLATAASLELSYDEPSVLPDVWADRDRLLQVFENLIGNAVKFTPPGGRITVAAAPRERDVLFSVADTGAGVRSDELPHLFDRFWQARTGHRRGAGLGLPIVRGIVEAHGGRVWAESTPGQGSTFYFTIPAAHREEGRAEPAAPVR